MITIQQFAKMITVREAKEKQVNIAQTLEILKITRTLLNKLGVDIYKLLRGADLSIYADETGDTGHE